MYIEKYDSKNDTSEGMQKKKFYRTWLILRTLHVVVSVSACLITGTSKNKGGEKFLCVTSGKNRTFALGH